MERAGLPSVPPCAQALGPRPSGMAVEQPQVSHCRVGEPVETMLGRAQLQAGSHLTQAGNPGAHHSRSPRHSWVSLPSQACFSCNLSFGSQPLSPCSRPPHSPPPEVGSFPPGPWPLELKLLFPSLLTPPKHHLDSSNKLTKSGGLCTSPQPGSPLRPTLVFPG